MIKGILFDMDGVLVNTEPLHWKSYDIILKKHGINLTQETYFEHWTKKGNGIAKYVKENKIDIDPEKLKKEKWEAYKTVLREDLRLSKELAPALDVLFKKYKFALVTSSYRYSADFVLRLTNLKKYFKVIISRDDVKEAKPSPECFLLAAKKLGVKPDECLVVEDAEKGIFAAVNAGMKSIAIPTKYTNNNDFSKATKIVKSIKEINPKLIGRL